ncbi:MAG: aminopeptidase P family protein [Saccharospirillaceae bacterium]|nr:aminopeptidase P family protein [Pseudomonadales bacterium]NRB81737.1 aminopeptidase P family protein [Saccharospirillaceae bacterium]
MNISDYKKVQQTAKNVLTLLTATINSDSTESSIVKTCIELMAQQGITQTWYHNVPAFVLLGSRSCLSVSGKDYQPATEKVGHSNIVTVDLSPMLGNIWGDCARTFVVENAKVTQRPAQQAQNKEFQEGVLVETKLHQLMQEFVTPNTLFCELFEFANQQITQLGYQNLDFLNNLGHSIEADPANRKFIDKNCRVKLSTVNLFTFEPHIRKLGGVFGFKHEDIYYFEDGIIKKL